MKRSALLLQIMIFLFLRHSPLYDLVEETNFIKIYIFLSPR